jgi:hypothetical protein
MVGEPGHPDCPTGREGKARVFFSEEKKQKTFDSWRGGNLPAMAGILGTAEK